MHADILIVDDSAILRKVMRKAVGQLGVLDERIFEARDGREALDVMRARKIDLVLLDMHMPVMDGHAFAVAKDADAALRDVPFVVVSTEANAQRQMEMVELGALGVLRKPFEPEELHRMVADYLPEEIGDDPALPSLDTAELDLLIANALERMAFVLTEHGDEVEVDAFDQHARVTYSSEHEEAEVYLSASEGFLREFAASLLGLEPEDPRLAPNLTAGLTELANILAGEIVVSLGGEEQRFVLGIPESCSVDTVPRTAPSASCTRESMGKRLQVNVFRRRSSGLSA